MEGIKRITTLLLAGSMALTFSACVRNDRIDTDGSDIEESSEEITGTSEEVLKWCESDRFYLSEERETAGRVSETADRAADGTGDRIWRDHSSGTV